MWIVASENVPVVVSITVPRRAKTRRRLISAGLSIASLCPAAHALEHITLRNGFSYDCTRHEQLGDRVRLYFAGTGENYQEIAADAISAVEPLPDPPAPRPEAAPAPATADVPTLLARAGDERNIDVALLASIVHAESNFRADAVSRAGARGLMQLMPGTAREHGVTDASQPDQNIRGGTAYLNELLNRYDAHDTDRGLALALAAYNAGPAAVDKYHGVPPYRETRAYVNRVMKEFARLKKQAQKAQLASR